MANTVESGFWSMLGLFALGAAPLAVMFLFFRPGKHQPPHEKEPSAMSEALFEGERWDAPPPEQEPSSEGEGEQEQLRMRWLSGAVAILLLAASFCTDTAAGWIVDLVSWAMPGEDSKQSQRAKRVRQYIQIVMFVLLLCLAIGFTLPYEFMKR